MESVVICNTEQKYEITLRTKAVQFSKRWMLGRSFKVQDRCKVKTHNPMLAFMKSYYSAMQKRGITLLRGFSAILTNWMKQWI